MTVTRAELCEKVWSTPMVTVAKEFGISDRGPVNRKAVDTLAAVDKRLYRVSISSNFYEGAWRKMHVLRRRDQRDGAAPRGVCALPRGLLRFEVLDPLFDRFLIEPPVRAHLKGGDSTFF